MNNFPKVFCVTLKDTPVRQNYIKYNLLHQKIDFDFFEGINGRQFGLVTTIPYKEDDPTGPDYFIKAGRIGCLLTHYMLWKTLSYLPYDEFLILEDDVILCDNFKEKFIEFKNQLPLDWQYVFVGNCCLPPIEYQTRISNNIITSNPPPMCTHAYMIKKSSIETLLDTNHHAWAAVDIQIQKKSLSILKHYIFDPPLADQLSLLKQRNSDENIDTAFESLTLDSKYI
jgi:GR25 family glycosyltransferase involved in LPS biosynthesis